MGTHFQMHWNVILIKFSFSTKKMYVKVDPSLSQPGPLTINFKNS